MFINNMGGFIRNLDNIVPHNTPKDNSHSPKEKDTSQKSYIPENNSIVEKKSKMDYDKLYNLLMELKKED